MKKSLKIIVIVTTIISVVSALVLGYIYLEDIFMYFKKMGSMITGNIGRRSNEKQFEQE